MCSIIPIMLESSEHYAMPYQPCPRNSLRGQSCWAHFTDEPLKDTYMLVKAGAGTPTKSLPFQNIKRSWEEGGNLGEQRKWGNSRWGAFGRNKLGIHQMMKHSKKNSKGGICKRDFELCMSDDWARGISWKNLGKQLRHCLISTSRTVGSSIVPCSYRL